MKAFLKNYRQSPRKVRLLAGLIRGKRVTDAQIELEFLAKRASGPFLKLLDSAVANAKAINGLEAKDLFVESVSVDQGITLKRRMPRARGSAFLIRKKSSHIKLSLTDTPPAKTNKKKAIEIKKEVETVEKEEKPVKAKKVLKVKENK